MPNITLALDEKTHRRIKRHPGINWSQVAREAFERRLNELHMWDALLADSRLTEREAIRTGDEIKRDILKRLGW